MILALFSNLNTLILYLEFIIIVMSLIKSYNSYIGLGLLVFGLIVIWKSLSLGIIAIIIGVILYLLHLGGQIQLAESTDTLSETLQQLACDKNEVVRGKVASNSNTPSETLQQLACDKNAEVRGKVARNMNTPRETLYKLTEDLVPWVRDIAIKNPFVPTELSSGLYSSDDINVDLSRENIKSFTNSEQQNVSEKEQDALVIHRGKSAEIYNSFLDNFYYHRGGIKIHLRKLLDYSNCWDCNLMFEEENISRKINILSWDNFISVYIDPVLQDESFYGRYKPQIHSISYDLKIIMEVKASLVMLRQTTSYKLFENIKFDSLIHSYIMQICDVIFNDKSETFDSFDPLIDNIINSVSSSFWDEMMMYGRVPRVASDDSGNVSLLTIAFIVMFYTIYANLSEQVTNSAILKSMTSL